MTKLYRNSFGSINPMAMKRNEAHTGLIYNIGLTKTDDKDNSKPSVTNLLNSITKVLPPPIYKQAFDIREKYFESLNTSQLSTKTWTNKCVSRLLLGLGDENVIENGIRLNGTYGMPIIPGSSIKGVASSLVYRLYSKSPDSPWYPGEYKKEKCIQKPGEAFAYTFGTESEAGNVIFHDAWLKPSDTTNPFCKEVISVHHQDYYSSKALKASEGDTPIPNHFIATQGSFLFAISSPSEYWTNEIEKLVKQALKELGIGAKGTSGYGVFISNEKETSENLTVQRSTRRGFISFRSDSSEWILRNDSRQTIALTKGNEWLDKTKDQAKKFAKKISGKLIEVEVEGRGERDLKIIKFIKKL